MSNKCAARHPEQDITCLAPARTHANHFAVTPQGNVEWANEDFQPPRPKETAKTAQSRLHTLAATVAPEVRGRIDAAVDRVEQSADEGWKQEAKVIVRRLAETRPGFTADDVWAEGLAKPIEPRALGAIFRWASQSNLIEKTHEINVSEQVTNHGSMQNVWKSKVYAPPSTPLRNFE